MKAYFVIPAVAVSALLFVLALVQVVVAEHERLAWLAAAVANLPLPIFIAKLHYAPIARTSENLPLLILPAAAGAIVAAWETFIEGNAGWFPVAVATAGLLLLLLYIFWYSRYGRFPNPRLAVGSKLPDFELAELDGNVVTSRDLTGKASVFIFHQGNWCPLCVAQLHELAARSGDLQRMDIAVNIISPQPEGKTRALISELGVPMRFLVDRGNQAAESLSIAERNGVPARARREYSRDTVMPTVIVTNAAGTILYADETDNYRVRPEPDIYISILRRTGAVAT